MNKKKKTDFGMNVGSTSMLLVFVLLCLVSFASLSIISANADWNLSKKVSERTANYYAACNSAQTFLAETDDALAEQFSSSANAEEYFRSLGHDRSMTFPISDTQALLVEIEILYPKTDQDSFYRIKTWKTVAH